MEYCARVLARPFLEILGDSLEGSEGTIALFVRARDDPRIPAEAVNAGQQIVSVIIESAALIRHKHIVELEEPRFPRK